MSKDSNLKGPGAGYKEKLFCRDSHGHDNLDEF